MQYRSAISIVNDTFLSLVAISGCLYCQSECAPKIKHDNPVIKFGMQTLVVLGSGALSASTAYLVPPMIAYGQYKIIKSYF